jgi:hypothetical protein
MEASHKDIIQHIHKSQNEYSVSYENNFLILPDGKTIISAGGSFKLDLICEDITRNDTNACVQIGYNGSGNHIYTLCYDTIRKSLFVGDRNGHVIEYQQKENFLSWEKTKDYGNLEIGEIYSSEQIEDILVFGGRNSLIRAIDCAKKALIPGKVKAAIKSIDSLQAYELSGKKIFLAMSGWGQNYSEKETDIYEVTNLAKAFNYDFQNSKIQEKKHSLCGCDSKKMMEVLVSKLEHYLEVFTGAMMNHFNKRFHSKFGRSSRYGNIELIIHRI